MFSGGGREREGTTEPKSAKGRERWKEKKNKNAYKSESVAAEKKKKIKVERVWDGTGNPIC